MLNNKEMGNIKNKTKAEKQAKVLSAKSNENNGVNNKNFKGEVVVSKTKKYAFIWLLITLAVVALVSVGFNVFLSIKLSEQNTQNQTFLNTLELPILDNQSTVKSVTMLNNIVGGVEYPQKVVISGEQLTNKQVVRAKAVLTNCDGKNFDINFTPVSNWLKGTDGYFYFDGTIFNENKSVLTEQIILPEKFSSETNCKQNHTLTFVIECLNYADGCAGLIWSGAPDVWLETYVF